MGEERMRVNRKGPKCIQSLLFFKFKKMSDGFASRFDQDIVHLLQDKDSKSTNTSTKLAIDLLKQFCAAKGRAFKKQSLEKSKLDGLPKSITGELFTL